MKKAIKGLAVTATTFAAVATLAACVPGTADKAKTKLEKAGYEVTVVSGSMVSMSGIEGLDSTVVAMKDNEYVSAMYFTSTDAAKKFYDENSKDLEEGEIVKRSGKVVYGGTETAVKDFN